MKVYEAVANAFVKEGTTAIFGLLGDGQLSWWTTMAKHPGIKIIDARHEAAALTMAEGWAIATGKIGVCSVTHGPGVSHTATSLVTATRSRTPIVVYTSKTPLNNERAIHVLNQERLVTATGAGYIEVQTPAYAEEAVRQAFYQARLESRPIVLAVPLDIQGKECDADGDDYQPSATMFSGQQRIRPDVDRLNCAADIIARSKKPVIVVGRGAMQSQAAETIRRLATRIGALIATTLPAKGFLSDYEYHAGIAGNFATRTAIQFFAEADCMIAIGASLNTYTIQGGYLFPEARIIHIDVAPHVQMGNEKGSADCYVQGDATATTQALDEVLAQRNSANDGFRTATVRRALRDAYRDPSEFEITPGTVDPREAARVMDEHLPANVGMVTAGTGHCFSFPVMMMQKPRPLNVLVSSFGCIGQGVATAVGVAVAANGEPIVHVEGDAGAMQNIQELDTAARLGLKLLFVILNDEALGAEYHKLRAKGLDSKLGTVRSPDFGAVGRSFGCRGRKATTLEEVAAGIDEFLAGEGPMVLDIRISSNVVNIPYRRLHFGQDV